MTQPTAVQLRELMVAVLERDKQGYYECPCMSISRKTEREYENGTCPHQRARDFIAASEPAPEPQGGVWSKLETWLGTYADAIPEQAYHELCAIQSALTPKPSTPQDVPVSEFDFCWLVELFLPYGGNSLGYYHTGFTDLSGASRSTKDPLEARKYKTLKDAQYAASKLEAMQGEWRAVEHGFERVRHVEATNTTHTPQAESVPVVGGEESQ